jgi:hypothetical protein
MALIVADRVQETSTTTGTGSITLGGAVTGFQAFSSVLASADTTYYTIADQGGANWEVGLGTFTSPSTLARTTILSSSNAGSAVNFTAGTKSVFITYPAGRSVLSNASGVVPVPAGGTGAATLTANNVLLGNGTSAVQFVAPSTNGNVLTSNGTTWTSTAPAVGPASYTRTAFTATGGQTTFTVSYVVGAVQVYVNGALLNSADYTASNGTSVVLASACLSGDIVEFIAISGGTLALTTITVGTTALSGGSTGRVLYDNAGLVGEIAAGTSGNVLTSDGTSWTSAAASPTYGYRRNRIINGSMVVDQRNAGATGTGTGYTVDRWAHFATQASKGTWRQNLNSVTVAPGYPNYLGFQSSSAYTVLAADTFLFYQPIEGYNFADLSFGTASAQSVTISFVVYSSLTGTFGGVIKNYAATRSYPFTYSIPTANTWTSIFITIPGDTSGTWVGNTNAGAAFFVLGLGVGSTGSGAAGAWASADYNSATGAVSVVGTNGATFYVTGVQLEAGSLATPFERLPIGETLLLCQRYYEKSYNDSGKPGSAPGGGNATYNLAQTGGTAACNFPFNVRKRATPTIAIYDGAGTSNVVSYYISSWNNGGSISASPGYQSSLFIQTNIASAFQINFDWTASAEL